MAASAKTILLKTRVGVDGEQTYRDALKNINRELKVLKTEMTAATSAFGNNQNSVEALTAKQQALSRQPGGAHRKGKAPERDAGAG